MKKFYLIQNDREVITDISTKIGTSRVYQFSGLSHNREEVMRNIATILRCDVVIASDHIPGFTIEDLIFYLTSQSVNCPNAKKMVKVLSTSGDANRSYLSSAQDIGYDLVISTAWNSRRLVAALDAAIYEKMCNSLDNRLRTLRSDGINIPGFNEELTNVLHETGIPASLTGYLYLKRAIEMAFINIETVVGGVTKIIYPSIAIMYKTSSTRVERSIRHAIESGWIRANAETMDKIFSYSYSNEKGKPTNGEFIANIADYLLVKFRRERIEYLKHNEEQFVDIKSVLSNSHSDEMEEESDGEFAPSQLVAQK